MTDNIQLNTGTGGSTLSTDDVAGIHYQRVKLIDGTADSLTEIKANNGVAANALRVTIASDSTGQVKLADSSGTAIGEVSVGSATTSAGDLAKASDAVHASGDVGVQMLAVRGDTPANLSGTDGDYEPLQVSAGRLWTSVVGDAAHDAAVSGNPVLIGGEAKETDGTDPGSVAEGDASRIKTDLNGRVLVITAHPALASANDNQSSAQTATSIISAPAAGLSVYITDVTVSALTAQTIKLHDEDDNVLVPIIYLGATGTVVMNFKTPIRAVNAKAIEYTSTAAVATSILVNYYTAP